ncbi:MAG: hypothetical protein ACRENP_04275 [Longimicrobiales bacterium]
MKHRNVAILTVAAFAACASGGGRGSAVYQREIGNASATDAVSRALLILSRNHFEVYQQEAAPFIRIETHWRTRRPFTDEVALGITNAESRVIVTARVRGETDVGSVYSVRMAVENRVKVGENMEWNDRTNTPMFRKFAEEMTGQFRTELINIGVRRYQ